MKYQQKSGTAVKIVLGFGGLIGLWALAAMGSALHEAGSLTELVRQYMVATGMISPMHTLVDYYTHIKGIEYLICAAFFVAFPIFFNYVNREEKSIRVRE